MVSLKVWLERNVEGACMGGFVGIALWHFFGKTLFNNSIMQSAGFFIAVGMIVGALIDSLYRPKR